MEKVINNIVDKIESIEDKVDNIEFPEFPEFPETKNIDKNEKWHDIRHNFMELYHSVKGVRKNNKNLKYLYNYFNKMDG